MHNSEENIKHCLNSIRLSTDYPHKIILIESESTDGSDKWCDTWAEQFEHVYTYHKKKEGLITAMNQGINRARDLGCDSVYLTQDDVIHNRLFGRDWLEILDKVSKNPNCGAVTTINAGGVSGGDYIDGFEWVGTWSLFLPMKIIDKLTFYEEI